MQVSNNNFIGPKEYFLAIRIKKMNSPISLQREQSGKIPSIFLLISDRVNLLLTAPLSGFGENNYSVTICSKKIIFDSYE